MLPEKISGTEEIWHSASTSLSCPEHDTARPGPRMWISPEACLKPCSPKSFSRAGHEVRRERKRTYETTSRHDGDDVLLVVDPHKVDAEAVEVAGELRVSNTGQAVGPRDDIRAGDVELEVHGVEHGDGASEGVAGL